MPLYWLVVALTCAGFLVPAARPASAAAAAKPAKKPPTKLWLIKVNDLDIAIGARYGHDFRWIACGLGTAPPYASQTGRCRPGQVPIYANFKTFRNDVRDHRLTRGMTVVFDQEIWAWTPPWEQKDPALYLREAGQIARAHGITLIETVYQTRPSQQIALAVAAARYASVVSIQSQRFDNSPSLFLTFVQDAVHAIRKVNKHVPIMAGLATDAGGWPVTAADITAEYNEAYPLVQGFWLNANQWATGQPDGCEDTGCGSIGRDFLASMGVTR